MSLRAFGKQHLHSPAWSETTPGASVRQLQVSPIKRVKLLNGITLFNWRLLRTTPPQ